MFKRIEKKEIILAARQFCITLAKEFILDFIKKILQRFCKARAANHDHMHSLFFVSICENANNAGPPPPGCYFIIQLQFCIKICRKGLNYLLFSMG
jgi:hypothetical protein